MNLKKAAKNDERDVQKRDVTILIKNDVKGDAKSAVKMTFRMIGLADVGMTSIASGVTTDMMRGGAEKTPP
jgi:hypothetical protein